MTVSRAWLIKTVEAVLVVAATAFVGALAAGGTNFSVPTVRAAALAAWSAAVTAVQAVLAGLINPPKAPPTPLVTSALAQRVRTGKGPADLPPAPPAGP